LTGRVLTVASTLAWGLALATNVRPANAQTADCETDILRLTGTGNDAGATTDRFGWSVAVQGDLAFVSAKNLEDLAPPNLTPQDSGAVFIYERDGVDWIKAQRLTASDALLDNQFGYSVSVSGDLLIVGAFKGDAGVTDAGAAYAFRNDGGTWDYETRLGPFSGFAAGNEFGSAVGIDGDWAIVGAPGADPVATNDAGTVYFFWRNPQDGQWSGSQNPPASPRVAGDELGSAVAISGDWAIAGAPFHDEATICLGGPGAICNSGTAIVFRKSDAGTPGDPSDDQWLQHPPILVPTDLTQGDELGTSVAMDGDVAVIGAIKADGTTSATGAAWVYRRNDNGTPGDPADDSWEQEQKLFADDGAANVRFGQSVAIKGDTIIVGSYWDDDACPGVTTCRSGSAYVFRFDGNTWNQEAKLTASDARQSDQFGSAVALSDDYAAIGAPVNNTSTGMALVFRVAPGEDCEPNGVTDECQLAGDPELDTNQNGLLDTCECEFNEDCDDILPCTIDVCNAESRCAHTPDPNSPGSCAIDGFCTLPFSPDNPLNPCQTCDPSASFTEWTDKADGSECDNDFNDCTQDVCRSGTCTKENLAADTACGDPTETDCDLADTCNGFGLCGDNFVAGGTACTDDGNDCTDDVCDDGFCIHPDSAPDTPCGDATDDACTDADTCDGAGACLDNHADDGTPCLDALFCNGEESCEGGVCVAGDPECDNPGLTCDEDTDTCKCTDAEACDDGLFCNGLEICNANGVCESPGDLCDGNTPLCDESENRCVECLDAFFDCGDGNECTDNVCDDGTCTFPPLVDGTPCGNPAGTDCTAPDTCDGAGVCQDNHDPAGTPCGDFTDTICNPADTCDGNANCLDNIPPAGTPCPDGLFCNGEEKCNATGICNPGAGNPCAALGLTCVEDDGGKCQCESDAECNDGDNCTDDACVDGGCQNAAAVCAAGTFCDPADGACVACLVNADCNDNLFCTGVETCVARACQASGNPCPAGKFCDEAVDACVDCTTNAQCPSDGTFCNGPEICSNGTCVSAGSPCTGTSSICLEESDTCVQCITDADCNDNKFCTGVETCTGGLCVASGNPCSAPEPKCDERLDDCFECFAPEDCDDNDDCTDDRCPDGSCVNDLIIPCDLDQDGIRNELDICPDTSPGAAVDGRGCSVNQIDDDGDGLPNVMDACPDTPQDETADAFGCSPSQRDDDGDGLFNDEDECPETPSGEAVDSDGCGQSQLDDDNDGVFNDADECPDTPQDELDDVNADGCSSSQIEPPPPQPIPDEDDDGVSDDEDECPDTPAEEVDEVDAAGCSPSQFDTDNDGVSDAVDQCPDTPAGDEVNDDGCTVESPNGPDGPGRGPCGFFNLTIFAFMCMCLGAMRRSVRRRGGG